MNHDERLAKRIVQTAMPELRLHFNSDQSKSVADFSMTKDGVAIGQLEVTRFTSQDDEQLRSEMSKSYIIERKHCQSDWLIFLDRGAHVKSIRKCADQYLSEIEKAGLNEFSIVSHAKCEPVRRIRKDLLIQHGKVIKRKCPGIYMIGPASGGAARSEKVWASVRQEVWKEDNLKKLDIPNTCHRHLFVVIEGLQGPAYVSIRKSEPPEQAPNLPSEITHLWVAAEQGSLAFVWLADSIGWANLTEKVNPIFQ